MKKICLNIVSSYLKHNLQNIRKLFRISLRILYIIFHKQDYTDEHVIDLFSGWIEKFIALPLEDSLLDFKSKVIREFIDTNFWLLGRKRNLINYYLYFYNQIILLGASATEDEKLGKVKSTKLIFMECLEELIKYELSLPDPNLFYEMSYIKLLKSMFNVFLSEVIF